MHPVATATIRVAGVMIIAVVVMTVMMPIMLVCKYSTENAEREAGNGVARAMPATAHVDHVIGRGFLDRGLTD